MAYHKPSVPPVDGAVNVCAIELSPLVAPVVPSSAACVPPCAPLATTEVDPTGAHALRSPVSKSPLVIGLVGVVEVTMSCGESVWEPLCPTPVTANGYEPDATEALAVMVIVALDPVDT